MRDMNHALMYYETTLCVVTASHEDRRSGCVCGTFAVAAVSDPHVTISLANTSYTLELIQKSQRCAINFLASGSIILFRQFALLSGRDRDKFQGVDLIEHDLPILSQATGTLICGVVKMEPVVDRNFLICKVEDAISVKPAAPYRYRIADSWPLL